MQMTERGKRMANRACSSFKCLNSIRYSKHSVFNVEGRCEPQQNTSKAVVSEVKAPADGGNAWWGLGWGDVKEMSLTLGLPTRRHTLITPMSYAKAGASLRRGSRHWAKVCASGSSRWNKDGV